MMGMSIPYEETGRTQQKARTRAALVQAARELLAEGVSPTVEQAADAAQVSRTTAYRYFPNQRALLVATFPEVAASSLVPDTASEDPKARFEAVVETLASRIVEHEPALRAQLRLSLEPDAKEPRELPYRTGRAIGWIEDALVPLRGRMTGEELRRLALATRCAVGIEALVWLTDVAGLSRDEAVEMMRWSARRLFQAAVSEPSVSAD
jgi:AcrR family transcriptional regulator